MALREDGKVTAVPTLPGTGLFTVARRLWKQDVLMPMRMDVVVEPDGRISAFTGRDEEAPAVLPARRITPQEARSAARSRVPQGSCRTWRSRSEQAMGVWVHLASQAGRQVAEVADFDAGRDGEREEPHRKRWGSSTYCPVRAMAEDTRFELVRGCPQHAFQACALGH